MTSFLIGCTHFGHANIIKLANRPFGSVEEMDEVMIENWNKTVKPQDIVYHLGDFAWSNHFDYLSKLNGTVDLISGNHDRDLRFNSLCRAVPYHTVKLNKRRSVLFHYPIEEWDGWFKGNFHFHCHTHKTEFVSAERRGNVGVDAINFTPIALEDAMAKLDASAS